MLDKSSAAKDRRQQRTPLEHRARSRKRVQTMEQTGAGGVSSGQAKHDATPTTPQHPPTHLTERAQAPRRTLFDLVGCSLQHHQCRHTRHDRVRRLRPHLRQGFRKLRHLRGDSSVHHNHVHTAMLAQQCTLLRHRAMIAYHTSIHAHPPPLLPVTLPGTQH